MHRLLVHPSAVRIRVPVEALVVYAPSQQMSLLQLQPAVLSCSAVAMIAGGGWSDPKRVAFSLRQSGISIFDRCTNEQQAVDGGTCQQNNAFPPIQFTLVQSSGRKPEPSARCYQLHRRRARWRCGSADEKDTPPHRKLTA